MLLGFSLLTSDTVDAFLLEFFSFHPKILTKVQFSSVAQSCLTLCNPMNCSMSGLLVHHQLLELAQTHVHWFTDAIQPSHPLSSPTPPAFYLAQHQGLFKWINSSVINFLYGPTLTSIHDLWKNHSFDKMDLCWQIMSLLFNMLSRLVIAFLPRRSVF